MRSAGEALKQKDYSDEVAMKIKEHLKVTLSVCIIYAGIIIGLLLIRKFQWDTRFTRDFAISLMTLRSAGGVYHLTCMIAAILIFTTAIVDSVMRLRAGLAPLLSAVVFLLTIVPFAGYALINIPSAWFISVVLLVYYLAANASARKMTYHCLGHNCGMFAFLKKQKQMSINSAVSRMDKTICCILFWQLFLISIALLVLLMTFVIMNRYSFFS